MTEPAYVLGFHDIDQTQAALVGGKGATLGALSRIQGLGVPPGFCVTTHAFHRIMAEAVSVRGQLDALSRLEPDDHDAIRALSADIRQTIEGTLIPDDLAAVIVRPLTLLGEAVACAVRSSSTAEDSPTASFAGQHDSYLNIVGREAILQHVSRCWASLFTERAVAYRLRNGVDHRKVSMAVVVQRMVVPYASGVLFTADPVSGNRSVASVEAVAGLGETLLSGYTSADVYSVRGAEVVVKATQEMRHVLTDEEAVQLVALGRRIEAHFGCPQDIEWCLAESDFHIVQSRPITTLFPIPQRDDGEPHVYLSVGHQQMMTDAMKPLGVSMRQLTAATTFHAAGGRVFVDVTRALASPASRAGLMNMAGKSDPLTGDVLQTIVERGDFLPSLPDAASGGLSPIAAPAPIQTDPAIVQDLMARCEDSIAELKREISTTSGPALLDFILADVEELKRILFDPRSHQVFMSAMEATWWLNEHLEAWLGEKNAADTLTQSVPHNVTSEMGLALLDVADVIRPHAGVMAFLQRAEDDRFLDELPALAGGRAARDTIISWLDRFGMRCAGEIDITRPRWSERPSMLIPLILVNVRNFEPGEGARRFERGRREAEQKEHELLERLRTQPDGEQKADETKQMINRVRTFIGYREYPKYGMVSRYWVYKQALLAEAERLVRGRVINEKDDMYFLTFHELRDVVHSGRVNHELIRQRKEEFRWYQTLTPPRVLTSEGEVIHGAYRRGDLPPGALAGLAVSTGIVEGRARVILDMAEADFEPGDILVTTFTDPSWTPLFVAIAGLVTEVGGLMTHGAVIAREYGLPAVVGVEHATRLIRDGQRIRVHGAEGYVEVLG